MTEAETKTILRTLQNAYPQRYRKMAKPDADEMVRQWAALAPYDAVKAAVDNWIASQRFHPTISDIRSIMTSYTGEDPVLSAFKSMLRFRASQLRSQIKPPKKLETETDKQRSDEAQQKLDALYERYGHLLEDAI